MKHNNNNTPRRRWTVFVLALLLLGCAVGVSSFNQRTSSELAAKIGQAELHNEVVCSYGCCKRGADLPPFSYRCPNRK